MKEINVHEFSSGLNETFRRYLATSNLIADTEPNLREEIWRQLGEVDLLMRQPFVTSIPAYKPYRSGIELLNSKTVPSLTPVLSNLNPHEFDLNISLYKHQVSSVEKAQNGKNIIVATGTGSGKTECFLLPVLDDAAKQNEIGVRTIIIYPMNALANDQLDRLRNLLKDLPKITFGRYTGETPETRSDLTDEEKNGILENERFTREEIRSNPPHILLTNFAMLEYLLLRPNDNSIFRQELLRFVVLDEAHSYNGAQGIDISFLMRRLTQKYKDNKLQFILTSATLTEEETPEAKEKIATFGESLTGADFDADDVIFGDTIHSFADSIQDVDKDLIFAAVPDKELFQVWLDALEDIETLKNLIVENNLPNKEQVKNYNTVEKVLYELLKDWKPVKLLYDEVSKNPVSFNELSKRLWNEDGTSEMLALKWLLTLSARAKKSETSPPLISARFHFFFRGLSGASVCVSPSCQEKDIADSFVKKIYLESRTNCNPACQSLLLPFSSCFQCGLPAVSIYLTDNRRKWSSLEPSINREEQPATQLFLTWDDSVSEIDEDEESENNSNNEKVELCLSCNAISLDGNLNECCLESNKIKLNIIPSGKDNNVKNCPRCGASSRPYPSVLRQFRSGDDAITAVLAEQMMRFLPSDEKNADILPAGGRKMLAFSDSRQRAAFFAPYLKRTTAETEYAYPLYKALLKEEESIEEPVPLEDISKRFVREAKKRKSIVLREYDESRDVDTYKFIQTRNLQRTDVRNLQRQATITLLKHFCASARQRTTWLGLGLATSEIELTVGNKEDLQKDLPEIFNKSTETGFEFIQQLLQIFLMRRAIYVEDNSITNKDLGKGAREVTFHYVNNDSLHGRQRFRWNPYKVEKIQQRTILNNYQVNVVAKYFGLDVVNESESISGWLERIWKTFKDSNIIFQFQDSGGEYQINTERILLTTKNDWAVCESCGRLTTFYVNGFCVVPKCHGNLKKLTKDELEEKFARYHYRHRVLKSPPMALQVMEHTAQLTNKHGQEYQKKFINGEINVLSSSTTFEMGVDVGGLKAVLLRNVPPTASNYIQRAGRAGRRRDGAAYAVTHARSLPHDQFYFHKPAEIIKGKVPVPLINLKNTRLAKRHINSFLLGEFLRLNEGSSEVKTVNDFFLSPNENESPFKTYKDFLQNKKNELLSTINNILPDEVSIDAEYCINKSSETLEDIFQEKVKDLYDSFKSQLDALNTSKATANGKELRQIANAITSTENLISQLQNEQLINFLSSAHWLPSYAFPQDTIRLFVRQPHWTEKMRLQRDREQGISEYAPGAEVIADGRLFKSGGVMRPRHGFEIRKYRYCRECRRLSTAGHNESLSPTCECGNFSQPNDYIIPTGFQTLYNDEVKEPDLYRLSPPSNSEIFLISGTEETDFLSHEEIVGVTYGYRRDGSLFRANAGYNYKTFRLCKECGRHFKEKEKIKNNRHETPWGTKCFGTLMNTHLAHEFETDILQLRFNIPNMSTPPVGDRDFWLSLTSAFTAAAAEVLAIPRNDLDSIYQSQNNNESLGELIIYDRVPGGAGYVERIIENLSVILQRTFEKTKNCENSLCDENSSCYTCLRNYQNQFYWDSLKRIKISEWLEDYNGLIF